MLRIQLTDSKRSELQSLRRSDLSAVARDRLEMVFLSDAGWSPPKIAEHLGRHPHTVRAALNGFNSEGNVLIERGQPDREIANFGEQTFHTIPITRERIILNGTEYVVHGVRIKGTKPALVQVRLPDA